jgi:hypothetical protein
MSLAPAQVWALVVLAYILPGASARAEVLQQLSGTFGLGRDVLFLHSFVVWSVTGGVWTGAT